MTMASPSSGSSSAWPVPFAAAGAATAAAPTRAAAVYRALVAARAAEARRRGHRYLTVDARETSPAILQRIGFQPLTTICDWTLAAA